MGAVAWGALAVATVLVVTAVGLLRWRRRLASSRTDDLMVDLVAAEADARQDDLAFDAIVGHLLLTDPGFADSADRLSRQDDGGATG